MRASRRVLSRFLSLGVRAIALLLALVPVSAAQVGRGGDVVVLVDVTRSVRGEGTDPTARDIWGPLRRSVTELLVLLPTGTNVLIIPFADGPLLRFAYPPQSSGPAAPAKWQQLSGPEDVRAIQEYIDSLSATGQATSIVPSIDFALDQLDLRAAEGRRQALYLYTDGIDNQAGVRDWLALASQRLANLRRDRLPYLWSAFVRPGLAEAPSCPPGGFDSCTGTTVQQPLLTVRLDDETVEFGDLVGAPARSVRQVGVSYPSGQSGPAALEVGVERTVEPPAADIKMETPSVLRGDRIDVTLIANPGAPVQAYTGNLSFRGSDVLFVISGRVPYRARYLGAAPTATPTAMPLPTAAVTLSPSAIISPLPVATAMPLPTAQAAATAAPTPSPSPTSTPPLPPSSHTPPPPDWVLPLVVMATMLGLGVVENQFVRWYF